MSNLRFGVALYRDPVSGDTRQDGLKIGERVWSDSFKSFKEDQLKVYAILGEAHPVIRNSLDLLRTGVDEEAVLL